MATVSIKRCLSLNFTSYFAILHGLRRTLINCCITHVIFSLKWVQHILVYHIVRWRKETKVYRKWSIYKYMGRELQRWPYVRVNNAIAGVYSSVCVGGEYVMVKRVLGIYEYVTRYKVENGVLPKSINNLTEIPFGNSPWL